jgi:AcrR family transcriptional regulator
MANRDPDATRRRIVEAARAVFAREGLAGARVDAIAAAAQTSKERLYANFRTKDDLFQVVLGESVEEWLTAVPFTVDDLPGYAVALFEHLSVHEIDSRLILWGQLANRVTTGLLQGAQDLLATRRDEVLAAQARGVIAPDWEPADLFTVVYGVVMSWLINPDEPSNRPTTKAELRRRQEVVRSTVARLVAV